MSWQIRRSFGWHRGYSCGVSGGSFTGTSLFCITEEAYYIYIYIHPISFHTLQICRVQTKTLGLAVIMLKTLGLSQKTSVFYKLSEFDLVLASNTSPTLLHHMFLRFSSIQPYRQEATSTYTSEVEKNATPTWKSTGREFKPLANRVQPAIYPCQPVFS